MDGYVNKMQGAIKTRSFRRFGILFGALLFSSIFVVALYSYAPQGKLPSLPTWGEIGVDSSTDAGAGVPAQSEPIDEPAPPASPPASPAPDTFANNDGESSDGSGSLPASIPDPTTLTRIGGRVDNCGEEQMEAHKTFLELQQKYSHLREDKFTIAMQTYKRVDQMFTTLNAVLEEEIPSLEEVVIIWNDLDVNPPEDYVTAHGINVRFKMSARNSLNSRLIADPDYKTQAVLLTDDDVYYHPQDLEFVFQTWRKFGKNRMTGALARCSTVNKDSGMWDYDFCNSKDVEQNNYAMVLTNLAFSHLAFMDYYSSDNVVTTKIRDYVDEHMNCEDLAMNFVASYLTREGSLEVLGSETYKNFSPGGGISTKPGHLEARSQCLNDFAEFFGCMPLRNETAHIRRGVAII